MGPNDRKKFRLQHTPAFLRRQDLSLTLPDNLVATTAPTPKAYTTAAHPPARPGRQPGADGSHARRATTGRRARRTMTTPSHQQLTPTGVGRRCTLRSHRTVETKRL